MPAPFFLAILRQRSPLRDCSRSIDNAEKERDPDKKARLYIIAEKVLQTSAGSFMKAEHPEKREQVLALFESVKEQRELAARACVQGFFNIYGLFNERVIYWLPTRMYWGRQLGKLFLRVWPVLFVAVLAILPVIAGSNSQKLGGLSLEPTSIPSSLTLLGAGARWAAQSGNSTLFIDWEDNYLAHGNTDGINWGPWPAEVDMVNLTQSIAYVFNQSGLEVHLAGDLPSSLAGYDLLVIHAYWAVEPRHLTMVRDFIANGGGVILLSGVPEFFRCYCKDWWTYRCPTDNASLGMDEIFGCDGNYFNTGGYANVTVDNPFGTSLLTGDTLFEGTGESNAAVLNPYNGSQIIASWNRGCTFAYTYAYGQGRVYFQAAFVPLDPRAQTSTANNSNNTNPTNDTDGHKGKVLVTPEIPFGTVGSVTAVAAAFGILAVFKGRKQ